MGADVVDLGHCGTRTRPHAAVMVLITNNNVR